MLLPLAEISSGFMILPCSCILFLFIFLFGMRIMLVRLKKSRARVKYLQQDRLERHKKDLELARQIQHAELRPDHPDTTFCKVDSFMRPMEEIGGDFYDHYFLPDGRLVGTIADVSGDGIPAAIFMMKAKTTLREQMFSCSTLEEAVTRANKRLCQNNDTKMFVTLWVGVLYPETGLCEYVCAGHNLPLWRHDGTLEWLPGTNSPALAMTPSAKFRMKSIQLHRGDHLFLYTDGVTEARNANGEMFTGQRLFDIVSAEHAMYIGVVRKVLDKFIGKAQQSDDITMMELKFRGNCTEPSAAVEKERLASTVMPSETVDKIPAVS